MRTGARIVFVGSSWLLVAGVVVQVFLAGLGVFDSPTRFESHRDLGYTLELLPIVMAVSGLVAGIERRIVGLTALIFVLFLLQSVFVAVRTSAPMVAALHPVNGFLIGLIALAVARWSIRRKPPVPTTSPGVR
jgi:uncharacterized membrane protein YjdF